MSTEPVASDAAVADPLSNCKPVAIKKVCAHCGSDDVFNEASVRWDVAAQSWTISNLFDEASYCDECVGEIELRDEPVEPTTSTPPPFSAVRLAEYVATHGFGDPLVEAFDVGRALFDQGDDYATVAAEIVSRGLTTRAEGRLQAFTIFVRRVNGRGPHHWGVYKAESEDEASQQALSESADDMDTDVSELEVFGVAMGDVEIVSWNG